MFKKLFTIFLFSNNKNNERRLRCFCLMISAVLEIAQLSKFNDILFCAMPRNFLGCPWSYRLIFLGDDCLFLFFFSEPFWSVFEIDDLCDNLGRNCVVAPDTPIGFWMNSTEFCVASKSSQTIGHDGSSCGSWA